MGGVDGLCGFVHFILCQNDFTLRIRSDRKSLDDLDIRIHRGYESVESVVTPWNCCRDCDRLLLKGQQGALGKSKVSVPGLHRVNHPQGPADLDEEVG